MKNLSALLFCLLILNLSSQVNIDFEQSTPGQYTGSTSVNGWTVQNLFNSGSNGACATGELQWGGISIPEFYVRQTPILNHPYLGTIPQSPLGGNIIVQMLDLSGTGHILRISQTFTVNTSNCLLQYAICGSLDGASHTCCDAPFARFEVVGCNTGVVTCLSNSISGNPQCVNTTTMLSASNGVQYTHWQVKTVDLTQFIGTCVTIRFIVGDCGGSSHHGSFYFDAKTSAQNLSSGLTVVSNPGPGPVSFCSGSGSALIQGPQGYATYSWVAPANYTAIPVSQATLSNLVVANPIPGTVFTLNLTTPLNCMYTSTYVLAHSTVSVAGIGSSPTCSNGTSGSATVQGVGSSIGYSYAWYNASNSVISTSSVLSNVAPGVYSVHLTSAGCGSAVSTVTVGINTSPLTLISKPYCGTTAYLGVSGGSNFQWYAGTSSISPTSGGQASSFTVANASSNAVYYLAYTTAQGCKDSLKYTLYPSNPGSLILTSNTVCVGGTNGTATITLPFNSSISGNNYFVVNSISPTPSYSAGAVTPATSFTLGNLVGAGQYTIEAFDGSCKYTSTLIPASYSFNFSFPAASPTLCGTNTVQPIMTITGPINPNAFTYSWSPPQFVSNPAIQFPVISPSVAINTSSYTTYSVIVTPTVQNCPLTKTYTVYYANLATPTIVPVAPVCKNSATLVLNASPGPGSFVGNPAVSATGEFTPAIAAVGVSSVTFVYSLGGCFTTQTATLMVNPVPLLQISGKKTLCSGDSTILTASGASTYSWSTAGTGSTTILYPALNMSVLVTGTSAMGCNASTVINIMVINTPSLQINNSAVCKNQSATLSVNGADTYSWSTGSTFSTIIVSPASNTNYTVTGINSGLCSQKQIVTVTVTPYPTLSVAGKTTVCVGDQVTFTVSGADTYSWSTASTGSVMTTIATGSKFYNVVGFSNPGNCSSTTSFNLSTAPCTGIAEFENDDSFKIFPNPNAGEFYVKVLAAGKLTVYSQLGQMLLTKQLDAGTILIDLGTLSNGIYLIIYEAGSRTISEKIIIEKN